MYNHAPDNYRCPFCLVAQQRRDETIYTVPSDVVYRTGTITAFVGSHQWPNNKGHVIVIPNAHYENLYDLPINIGTAIHAAVRRIAIAMKADYGCAGISTRQHNEPEGNQEIWHYHTHVFPRYPDDGLYTSTRSLLPPEIRVQYAACLRRHLCA